MKRLALVFVCITLLCSGCSFRSGDALLFPPKPPLLYEHLKNPIADLFGPDTEYAPPASGYNRQSIQSIDLDGDGIYEALVFLRNKTAERPLCVYIFEDVDGEFVQTGLISSAGDAIDSVDYVDFNADGQLEIVIGWQAGSVLKALTVHSLVGGSPVELMSARYTQYSLFDIDGDIAPELLLARLDETQFTGLIEPFKHNGEGLAAMTAAPLSLGVEAIRRIKTGKLSDGTPALFVTSQREGKSLVTDFVVWRDTTLLNVSLNMSTGVSDGTVMHTELFPTDIDGDGVIEFPQSVPLPPYDPATADPAAPFNKARWRAYDSRGRVSFALDTYHSVSNGWYLELPSRWDDCLTVTRRDAAGQRVSVFAYYREGEPPVDLLHIYTVPLSAGQQVDKTGKIVLFERTDVAILGQLPDVPPTLAWLQLSEAELRQRLRLISAEWLSGVR